MLAEARLLSAEKTWSPESLHALREWLQACTTSHRACIPSSTSHRLPLRLLDVCQGSGLVSGQYPPGMDNFDRFSAAQQPSVRLCSTRGLPPNTHYVTLSYRWAESPRLLLTKKTESRFEQGMDLGALPPEDVAIFRDAIHVTRCLGFRYIWIDALCIKQDDEEEKGTEIMNMGDIYGNCILNISASEGVADANGLVYKRDLLLANPCRYVDSGQSDAGPSAVFGEALRLSGSGLSQRGWVFQERTLAPRIVHFTRHHLLFECGQRFCPEWRCDTGGSSAETSPYSAVKDLLAVRSDQGPERNEVPSEATHRFEELWYRHIVPLYSTTKISFHSDRLLALSAVAQRYCAARKLQTPDYVAGVWKPDLPAALLWRHNVDVSGPVYDSLSLAPSWSWASSSGEAWGIVPHRLDAKASVVSVHAEPMSRNPFDGTRSCVLRLQGRLWKFCRREDGNKTRWYNPANAHALSEVASCPVPGQNEVGIVWDRTTSATKALFLKFQPPNQMITAGIGRPALYFLHVANSQGFEEGLVLHPRDGALGGYVRVGFWMLEKGLCVPGELERHEFVEGICGQYVIDIY